jgi:hypothetical protein
MTVVALDPGGTTGVAILDEPQIHRDQVDTSSPNALRDIWDILNMTDPEDIVMERFQFRYGGGRSKVVLTPVEVIGVVKLYCAMKDIALYEQTPAQAKKLITDDKIRKLGLWVPGQPHAMDATRHLLYHLIVTRREKRWLEQLRQNE